MTSNLQHVVLRNSELTGLEYGMLRDFEDEISRITGANQVNMPTRKLPKFIANRIGHGTRYGSLRPLIPKADYELKADVLWVILMSPENYQLDLFKNWDRNIGIKILYLFDTFENQESSIRRILEATQWDLTITSFQGAVPFLEEITQRKWYYVHQGVKLNRFYPVLTEQKIIDFCAYGRRVDNIHNAVKKYCTETQKYYDYTTSASVQVTLDPREYYRQYAWHLNHSFFTFSWPVELTHPNRVKTFSPITCRWFEAASSCSIILGKPPQNQLFTELFGSDLVITIDDKENEENLSLILNAVWENRNHYLQLAIDRRVQLSYKWSWENRVLEILKLLDIT